MATTQNYSWPASSDVTITGIGNPTGVAVPTDAVYVAGEDPSGNLHGLQTDANGDLLVSPLTNDSIVKAQLQFDNGTPIDPGQLTMAGSLPVVIASDQSTLPISAASLPLPAGASTSALQTQISAQLPATLGNHVTTDSLSVNIASDQVVPVSATALPLPSGAATAANQVTEISSLSTIATNTTGLNLAIAATASAVPADAIQIGVKNGANLVPITQGQAISANSIPVVLASDQSAIPSSSGRSLANAPARNVYSSVNVTTGAYVQLVASTTSTTNLVEIFDSSGQTMAIAIGAAAAEVIQFYIFPGGNGQVPLRIPSGSRVSVIAISATASSGEIDVNFYT